jgi:hypothetical protein
MFQSLFGLQQDRFAVFEKKTFQGSSEKITSGIIDLMATLEEQYCSKNKLREAFQTDCRYR